MGDYNNTVKIHEERSRPKSQHVLTPTNTEGLLEDLLELSVLHHLLHNIQSTDELPVDDQLREGGPVIDDLELRPHALVRQDVEVRELDALVSEQRDDASREAAPGRVRAAFHEEHDAVLVHDVVTALVELLLRLVLFCQRRCGWRFVCVRLWVHVGRGADVLGNCFCQSGSICAGYTTKQSVSLVTSSVLQHQNQYTATHLEDHKGRDRFNIERFRNVWLRLGIHLPHSCEHDLGNRTGCTHIQDQKLRVLLRELQDYLIHLLTRLCPWCPEVNERYPLQIC